MAPILLKKREDNNHAPSAEGSAVRTTKSAASATTANRTSVSSRETKERDNNAKVKSTEEPAERSTSSRWSASSSSSRLSSRSAVGKNKEPEKPEAPEPVSRKTVKTPPTATGCKTTVPAPAAVDKPPTKTPALTLPSQTLHKHKQAAVWTTGKKKHKTNFGAAYDSGSIPCRINHGGIRNAVQWTKEPDTIDFSPLLVTCVEGFQETEHPFVFLARTMFRELMKVEDVREKTLSVLPQVIPPLRVALMASDDDIFIMALEATRILSVVVEDEMNTYLPKITQQIHRKLLTKQLRTPVEETLATLERNGGKEALAIIRNKIPTYVSLH